MKRDIALQPLSHQHHNTLMGCLLIKKGVEKQADKSVLKDFILNWWQKDLQQHMQSEEKVLLPYLSQHQFDKSYLHIIHRDHETFRVLGDRLKLHNDGYGLYNIYADLVEQHIRFEERVVFQKIEEDFSRQQLSQLEQKMPAESRKCSDYPVKFWE
ncbi:MAG TPA: hemerythrin domain-containing protein [Flavitalea sp.]|nr:hemerythrin domain-containing protein [Flavitalea sp.]